ncbi:MAG: transcription-repair coupling factor [Ruminococcaceae bacterium]|nr:transcription-repair coupling factor [Oscillospiraceae bacterium]
MNMLTDCIRADGEYRHLLDEISAQRAARNPAPIVVAGLCDGASDAAYAALVEDITKRGRAPSPILLICSEEKECLRISNLLKRFDINAEFFITRDLNFYNIVASHEYEHERLRVLSRILAGELDVVVTTPDAAIGYTIPPERFISAMMKVEYGETVIDVSAFADMLLGAGYVRTEMVDAPGQFALRGGIVDVYPPYGRYTDIDDKPLTGAYPIRIELFGDEIDRMEIFDVESQRMTVTLNSAELCPAREILLDAEIKKKLRGAVAAHFGKSKDDRASSEMVSEIAAIDGGLDINFADKYITLVYPERTALIDYVSGTPCVLIKNTTACLDRLKASQWHLEQSIEELLENGTIAPKYTDYAKPPSAFDLFCERNPSVHFDAFGQGMSGKKLAAMFTFRTKHMVSYSENYDMLCEDLEGYRKTGYKIIVMTENEAAAKNLTGLLCDKGFSAIVETDKGDFTIADLPKNTIMVKWRQAIRGYELTSAKIVVLSTNSDSRDGGLSTGGRLKTSRKKKSAAERIMSCNDLSVGDFVVHEVHGIGQYMGIENLTVDGVSRDYVNIRYAGSDRLFLPTDKLDMISKYIGAHSDDGLVKLSKFSGGEWMRAKAKAKAAVKEMAKELIQLYAERMRRPGFAFPADDDIQRDFEAAFEYDETDGQLEAIEDIKKDMMSSVPMDRLLCGDVGFGKTEVALRAAYKAVLGGKQVAILVPTTILALQHFQTVTSRTRGFSVNVDMISRFRTPKQQAQTLRKLKRGEVDIIIGTHRLISKDIEFKDLGLLIVDEEQRFGVAQKEKLKQVAGNVDVLTLSATPIPRTLNMAMGGIRDVSVLDEAPGDRLPVQTYVLEHDELIIIEAIKRELRRGGQVFYLYNFVESIDTCASKLAKEIPEARITVAHGKMDKERLEDIWAEMLSGQIDILVCTTIIETGVDIPNANTLIVENAQRLGLSQLHQIRGRVGRSSRRAYAYFTFPRDKTVSEIATKRLEAIREYAEFGAGFKIAMRDLEIRGAGNILGAEQHGHLDAVGYDLYIKLLNEAVLEEKGEKPEEKVDTTITLKCDAFIPEKYVSYSSQRMELYKKIANIETPEDRDDVIDEMIDRFGDIPTPTQNLLTVALVRAAAIKCRITSVVEDTGEVKLYPLDFNIGIWSDLAFEYKGRLSVIMADPPAVRFRKQSGENLPKVLYAMLTRYLELEAAEKAEAERSEK